MNNATVNPIAPAHALEGPILSSKAIFNLKAHFNSPFIFMRFLMSLLIVFLSS